MKKLIAFAFLTLLLTAITYAVVNIGGEDVTITHTATRIALNKAEYLYVENNGTSTVWCAFGENTTPTTASFPLQAGRAQDFDTGGIYFVSFNCAIGETSTVTWGAFSRK